MARSSFSSGVGSLSPLGVILPIMISPGITWAPTRIMLGRNLKVAFMPWKGYNYEDAIVLNERVVREDILTSVHVDEYQLEVRETKRGMDGALVGLAELGYMIFLYGAFECHEFLLFGAVVADADIPNVSEDATKDLDERGIIRVGAHVIPGDIMP